MINLVLLKYLLISFFLYIIITKIKINNKVIIYYNYKKIYIYFLNFSINIKKRVFNIFNIIIKIQKVL